MKTKHFTTLGICFLCIFVFFNFASTAVGDLQDGLVVHLSLDENLNNSGSSGEAATIEGNPVWVPEKPRISFRRHSSDPSGPHQQAAWRVDPRPVLVSSDWRMAPYSETDCHQKTWSSRKKPLSLWV